MIDTAVIDRAAMLPNTTRKRRVLCVYVAKIAGKFELNFNFKTVNS